MLEGVYESILKTAATAESLNSRVRQGGHDCPQAWGTLTRLQFPPLDTYFSKFSRSSETSGPYESPGGWFRLGGSRPGLTPAFLPGPC